MKSKLFQMFEPCDNNMKMNSNGIGLGLAIAKGIINQFDGEIRFKSQERVGSTFTFTMKLNKLCVELDSLDINK